MFARGEFDLGAMPALTLPQQAVVVREGFSYVFRVNPDNRVNQVKVQIGRIAVDRLQVLSGVTADMHALILRLWAENRMTIFMVSHDIQESFSLGTRLLTFDKVRQDPQAPEAYGARVTYDLQLTRRASQVAAVA